MTSNITLHKDSLCNHPWREQNEDVEMYRMNMDTNGRAINREHAPVDVFIVCDGHGGKEVSEFVAPLLCKYFTNPSLKYPLSNSYIDKIYKLIQKKLVNHPNKIAETCGSTALVVIRYMSVRRTLRMQVINLGDCRAVMSNNGLAIPLTKDHKPFWPDEKRRIDHVDGDDNIAYYDGDWRISGLSVSRSFGDLDARPYVSVVPDIYDYAITDKTEFIILGCDGVWDVFENHDAVNFVRDHKKMNHTEMYDIPGVYPTKDIIGCKNMATLLAHYAVANGSKDNVSVLIVFFR